MTKPITDERLAVITDMVMGRNGYSVDRPHADEVLAIIERLRLAEDVVEAASARGLIDSGFTGEHSPDAMHDLRDALTAYREACGGKG